MQLTFALSALSMAFAFGGAPMQCASEPDLETRHYEEPAEALYVLAEDFKKDGDSKAWRHTLEHLIERYPNSRFAERAKQELGAASAVGAREGTAE
jgi:outer membrane protein assembly factor BamD (BamD/ComL family)